MEATQLTREDLIELIRELRGWADTYEDHMTSDAFTRRAAAIKRADDLLLAETGRIFR